MKHRLLVWMLCCLPTTSVFAVDYSYEIVDVPFAGASETELFGINNHGVAVGSYLDSLGMRRGFIFDTVANSFDDYAVAGATGTRLFGINDAGDVTGYWQEPGEQHGFVVLDDAVVTIDRPGFTTNYAWGINDNRVIAGYVFDFTTGFFITSHTYNVTDMSYTTVLFNAAGSGTVTRGINDAGVQVGWSLEPDGTTPGLIYEAGGFTSFSLGSDKATLPNDINNFGDIVGNVAELDFSRSRGFLRDASGQLSFLDIPDSFFTEALGINDTGIIVGSFEDGNEQLRSYIATPVPEPSTMVLFGGMLAGVLAVVRRSRAVPREVFPSIFGAAILVSLTTSSADAQLAPAYRLTDLGNLGGDLGYAQAISNTGYLTGISEQADHRPAIFRYFAAGPMQNVGIVDGLGASGRAVNDVGTIVGVSTFTPTGDFDNGPIAPVRARIGEALESLGLPAGFANGEALGVNNNDVVVGRVEDGNFDNSRPFVFTDGDGYQLLGTLGGAFGTANEISEDGVVVGFSEVAGGGIRGFRVTPDALGNYPVLDPTLHMLPTLGGFSNALDISADGQFIAGSSRAADQIVHGFIHDQTNGIRDLGLLPTSNFSLALGVNSQGIAVGFGDLTDANGDFTETVGWAWSEGQGIVQLDDLLAPPFAGTWRVEFADAINDSGWIVGSGFNLLTGAQHALLLTPVPEPSSLALLGMAAIGLMLARRRRVGATVMIALISLSLFSPTEIAAMSIPSPHEVTKP